jgi:hypothetical protein
MEAIEMTQMHSPGLVNQPQKFLTYFLHVAYVLQLNKPIADPLFLMGAQKLVVEAQIVNLISRMEFENTKISSTDCNIISIISQEHQPTFQRISVLNIK